jgi:hypothetical protein
MSFSVVFDNYKRTEEHLRKPRPEAPYGFVEDSLQRANALFLKWLNVYREYAQGYSKEPLSRTMHLLVRLLSSYGDTLEKKFRETFEARIPKEAYILLNELLSQLGHHDVTFILAEGSLFEQTSIYTELHETLNSMSYPRPLSGSAKIDIEIRGIKNQDIVVIYYEHGQYDNVVAWPLLLHEAFHHVYDVEKLSRLARDWSDVSWLQEALIDIYMTNYFGPAYAMSLATYLQRFPYGESISHPSFSARIFIALQYLTKLQKENRLPSAVARHISDVFTYLKKVWNQHRGLNLTDVEELVEKVYNSVENDVKAVISEKTSTFEDFLLDTVAARQKIPKAIDVYYPEKEIPSVSDVIEYFEDGIPIAVEPRILFNSFLSERYQKISADPALRIFVIESLKKWHLRKAWLAAKPT